MEHRGTSRIRPGQMLAFSSGNLSVNLISQAFAAYILFYYVDTLGVRPALISLAMGIHGILNAVLNPLLGHLSDRTRSRWGRRLPYMRFGVLPLAAVFALLWIPLVPKAGLFWYFLAAVSVYDVLFVLVVLNYSALFPEMFTTLKERAVVSSWRQMLGIVGLIVGVAVPPLVYSKFGWGAMGAVFGAVAFLFFLLMIAGSRENHSVSVSGFSFVQAIRYTFSNRAFVLFVVGSFLVQFTFALLPAGIPFFTKYVLRVPEDHNSILLGSIFIVAIPFVYVWGKILQRWGTRKTVMLAVLIYMLALAPFAAVQSFIGAAVTAGFVGVGLAGLLVLLDVLLSEVIDEDERRTGARREGMYFGMNGFIVRWGVSLQAAVAGVILEKSGYAANLTVQPESAVWGIRIMISLIPIAALLLSLLFFFLYPIGKRR